MPTDLRNLSSSYAEKVDSARIAAKTAVAVVLALAENKFGPEGLPDDVSSLLKDQAAASATFIQIAAVEGTPLEQKIISPAVTKLREFFSREEQAKAAIRSIASLPLLTDAKKLMLVAADNNLDPLSDDFRLVDDDLTFEEARRCSWNGTLAECRGGSILTGPADPNSHFVIYISGKRVTLRSGMSWKMIDAIYG